MNQKHEINELNKKSIKELRLIINNQDAHDAVTIQLARKIVKERLRPDSYYYFKKINRKAILEIFRFQNLFTIVTMVFAALAVLEIVIYYSDANSVENNIGWEMFLIWYLSLIINHILYRFEHKASNNFIGRVIHDFMFFILYFTVFTVYNIIVSGINLMEYYNSIGTIMATLFMCIIFEILNTLIKRFLRLFNLTLI